MSAFLRSSLLVRPSSLLFKQQIRCNWQIFVEKARNPQSGKTEQMGDARKWFMGSGLRGNPEAAHLLEYEKPWMKRKRIKISKVWKRREQTVNDLVKYIKVKRQLEKKD